MARKGGKDKGVLEWPPNSGKWYVRIYEKGQEKRYRCDTKSQAKALYGRIRAEIREGRFFPEKFGQSKEVTLRAWINRYLEGSTNKGIKNERRYGRFWTLLMGKRLLSQISTDDCRRIQARMKAKGHLKPSTINRYFSFLRHVLALAVKDAKLNRNPVSGVSFFPEAKLTRFLIDAELTRLQGVMPPQDWLVVVFSVETGLRRADQFKLRWDQVCLESSTLTVPTKLPRFTASWR